MVNSQYRARQCILLSEDGNKAIADETRKTREKMNQISFKTKYVYRKDFAFRANLWNSRFKINLICREKALQIWYNIFKR